ncbi:MAG TPA: choice-of-anchor tandem repeat GloVer-containing protein [Candidatus Cybelea sp.]|nr:choice-of-anchor tandem repeat GloVer-containing protein [Candidatus Cybelea sp.]
MSDLRISAGLLYGTTEYGGTTNARCALGCGTLFRVDASGRERVVYRFKGGSDGAAPLAGVVVDGVLYGTTSAGGGAGACDGGCGTVFKVSASGKSETVLHAFAGAADGAVPAAPLVRMGGILYGTTQYGGHATRLCPIGCGTVFSIRPQGDERVIYRFNGGKDGANPIAALHAYEGRLYGTTQYGGSVTPFCATGCGTVFKISAAGNKKTLHAFAYSSSSKDGAYPAAGVVVLRGKLYGTTLGGGKYADGTVFEIYPSTGSERVVHAFACCATKTDGQFPAAGLTVVNGILFGTTRDGGVSGQGTVFEIRPSGAETVLHDFGGKPDGATPSAALVSLRSKLYGTTAGGGSRSEGTVFGLTL